MVANSSSSVLEFLNLLANVVKRERTETRPANEGDSLPGVSMDIERNGQKTPTPQPPPILTNGRSALMDSTTRSQDYDTLQESAPKMLWFLDEYVADIKPRLLTLDPNDRKVKRKARHLLIELLFSTIDAATDDINDTFSRRRRQSSQASSRSGQGNDSVESVVGDMSDDEGDEMDEDARKLKVLGQIVKAELEELAEAAKEGIEELM